MLELAPAAKTAMPIRPPLLAGISVGAAIDVRAEASDGQPRSRLASPAKTAIPLASGPSLAGEGGRGLGASQEVRSKAAPESPRTGGTRRALGVDPGTARLGYAVVEERRSSLSLVVCGVIETPKQQPMPQRLLALFNALSEIVREYEPREMAVEELFFAKNTTTIISVGQARGIALLVAAEAGLEVSEYKPMIVKQAVHGYGLASKDQVGEMVRVLLGLEKVPKPDDAADAAAIAICHLHTSHLTRQL